MPKAHHIDDLECDVCGSHEFYPLDFDVQILETRSSMPELNDYVNQICATCGAITPYPQPSIGRLVEHYKTSYRESDYALHTKNGPIEPPLQIPWSGISFLRFQSFYDAVERLKSHNPDLVPGADDFMLDYGAYQGLFLYAAGQAYGCKGIAYDFNEAGLKFAQQALKLEEARLSEDIYADGFDTKVRFISMIHALEHLQYPRKFLEHVRENVILEGGYFYIEVPNATHYPLSEPRHYYSFTAVNLSYLLSRTGFEVVETWLSGHPSLPGVASQNPLQNLHCIARARRTAPVALPHGEGLRVYDEVVRAIRSVGLRALRKLLRNAVSATLGFFLHGIAIVLCDVFPSATAKRLGLGTGMRAMIRGGTKCFRWLS